MDVQSLQDAVNPEKGQKERKMRWPAFIETDAVNFFNGNQLEKMTLEDGNGNKAKLTRQKDDGIKVEFSSMTIL